MRPFLTSLAMLSVLGIGSALAVAENPGCPANGATVVTASPDQALATSGRIRSRSPACCIGDYSAPWDSAMTYPYWTFGYPKQSYFSRPGYPNPAFGHYYSGTGYIGAAGGPASYNPGP
jgi:hypothetical protein